MTRSLKKIVIIGPESTGKTTLSKQLASHYNADYCPEYAREYLLKRGKDYSYDDLLSIAKGQLEKEDETIATAYNKKKSLLFIDTDMYVMKVWCEFVFNKCHSWILQQIVNRKYDLYLLCNTDLPWVKDELREYPDQETREKLYLVYKDLLINQLVPWIEINGKPEKRFLSAIAAVDSLLAG